MGPEEEFKKFNDNNSWGAIYEGIKAKSSLCEYTTLDARRPEFKHRNRYRDVSPYDHSRIALKRDGIDYINANIVKAPEANRSYILTQGPLPNTCGHFWLMVWEQNSRAVLMLNRTLERGRVKCHQYFPMGVEDDIEDMEFEDVGLHLTFIDETNYRYFTVRTFRLQDIKTCESKEVLQFHYTTWPDFKVPSLSAFLNYLNAVRQSGALSRDVGPAVIHCSAGIGRSGTFCLVDTCLVLIKNAGTMDGLDVQDVLLRMRKYRMGLIQTSDQLRFSYEAIIEGGKRILSQAIDLGFPDEIANGSPCPPGGMEKSTDKVDDSDNDIPDIPPPLPPRRKPPSEPQVEEMTTVTKTASHPNGDTVDDMLDLMRGLAGGLTVDHDDTRIPSPDTKLIHRGTSVEVRRRNRELRRQGTLQQIERMKQRQCDSERWRNVTTNYTTPVLIGLGIASCASAILLFRYYMG